MHCRATTCSLPYACRVLWNSLPRWTFRLSLFHSSSSNHPLSFYTRPCHGALSWPDALCCPHQFLRRFFIPSFSVYLVGSSLSFFLSHSLSLSLPLSKSSAYSSWSLFLFSFFSSSSRFLIFILICFSVFLAFNTAITTVNPSGNFINPLAKPLLSRQHFHAIPFHSNKVFPTGNLIFGIIVEHDNTLF